MTQDWITRKPDAEASRALAGACGISSLLARTLVVRGIKTAEEAEAFLHPSLERDWSDPALIFGMTAVADALEEAVRSNKRILVFGDFDVDGISATACMVRALTALGASPSYLIPHRLDEGYGLTNAVLRRIYEKNPELLITVDCGISSSVEVAELLARGIQVLITDHHEASGAIPQNVFLTDPKMEKDSPSSNLAGVGVALKLIALLGERFNKPLLWRDLLDLATLGTLADFMPLVGENRALVTEGLALLERSPRPGIASVLALSKRGGPKLRSIDLSFNLIPRLNAAGRMADPTMALELLINDDPGQAFEIAGALDAVNNERRSTESALLIEASAQAQERYHGQKILIVAGENWHEGVRGIVASRLASRYGVPVIVFSLVGNEARGSGRSVGTVNIHRALERAAELTVRFGGHEAAAGVTVLRERLDEFKARMEAIMAEEPDEDFHPPLMVDAELKLSDLNQEAVYELSLLEPYGPDNTEPLYVSRDLIIQNARPVGPKKNHLSFAVTDGKCNAPAIWFRCPDIEAFVGLKDVVDVIYRPQIDEYNGRKRVKLMVTQVYAAKSAEPKSGEGADGEPKSTELPAVVAAPTPAAAAKSAEPPATPSATSPVAAHAEPELSVQQLAEGIIGAPVRLHPAQDEALKALEAGQSVLVVMATGRGKSLIFQVHAARLARAQKKASIFIYPLRALIADQAVHLALGFKRLGLVARSLTGENTTEEKDALFQSLYEGSVDVLLTTPEFFGLHAWRFAQSSRVAFIVFDEAHHIQTERGAGREGYRDLKELHAHFPSAQYLAVTATAHDRVAQSISSALGIERVIVDKTRRDNLSLDDARALKTPERESRLVSIVEQGSKTVIYANSRPQAIALARLLRKHATGTTGTSSATNIPGTGSSATTALGTATTSNVAAALGAPTTPTASSVAFYHAGLERAKRRDIEEGFRTGKLRTIISTSAFGEGVNIADISHVVLYHLPFSAIAFNQMSGRAGRDGKPATVHLLYTEADAQLNRRLLASSAPEREELVVLYQALRKQALKGHSEPDTGVASLTASCEQIAKFCQQRDAHHALDKKSVSAGLAIFEELGLLERESCASLDSPVTSSDTPFLVNLTVNKRVELSASGRYLEGREELALFEQFKDWAFKASADELREQIIGPLTPSDAFKPPAFSDAHKALSDAGNPPTAGSPPAVGDQLFAGDSPSAGNQPSAGSRPLPMAERCS
ncbi:MAG: single-stranded-DNA-specific exonuclease RecJ [Coriobacteriales bacterium]|jgi:single-stranded-DNA-specific exonuclease|nr:single-stranded-DNA-specific exonuclease RecJ [Coriobacteriales bacterium]